MNDFNICTVTLSKKDNNTYSLYFSCPENNLYKTRDIKIEDIHKKAPIGNYCYLLFIRKHTEWEININKNINILYEYSQPDLMLKNELYKIGEFRTNKFECDLCKGSSSIIDIPKNLSHIISSINESNYITDCSSCGFFILLGCAKNNSDLRNYLFYNNNNSNNEKKDLFVYVYSKEEQYKLKDIEDDEFNLKIISESKINIWKPKNLIEKIDMILRKLNSKNKHLGYKIDKINFFSLFFSESENTEARTQEIYFIYNYLVTHKYVSFYIYDHMEISRLDKVKKPNILDIDSFNASYKHFASGDVKMVLQENAYNFLMDNKVDSRNVFVAMNFPDENNWIKDCINEVLIENDLKMIHMKGYHHNGWIMDVIRDSIESSKFVICDFTQPEGKENSYGVYYESGFAEGKGKQVIHLCQKESINKLHFDILQKNYIEYKDEKELKEYLNLRIKAML
ncbi:MAG: hypothetical protein ACRDA7_01275 [Metamycoplasmataceae bacterium]